jgi:hypothetical protein
MPAVAEEVVALSVLAVVGLAEQEVLVQKV